MAERDLRWANRSAKGVNDVERTEAAVASVVGKRLKYRIICGAENTYTTRIALPALEK